jgi:DNA-binding transcriptional LysR family regulator
MIETRHLGHVLALARHRHFGRAAKEVFLTQSALSRSVQAFERQLGVRLFDRGRDGVEPTAFGELVVERARSIASGLQDLVREIDQLKGLEIGALSLAVAPYPSALSGQTAIARLLAEHPGIRCRVQLVNYQRATEMVAVGESDLGFAELSAALDDPGLATEVVITRPASFFCRPGHALADRPHTTIEELVEYPWVMTRLPRRLHVHLPADVGRAGSWDDLTAEFVPAIETNVLQGFTELATQSDALVAATSTIAEADLRAGRLRRIQFEGPWFCFHHGFITRRTRTLPPLAEEFMRLVRGIEAELDEREEELLRTFG